MTRRRSQIAWKAAALGAAVALFAAAAALAAVRVYSNDFSTRGEAREMRVAGKGCKKNWDEKRGRLRLVAKGGPSRCRLRVPVQGDAPQPDHMLRVTMQVPKPGGKSAKASSRRAKQRRARRFAKLYVAVSVRDGAGGRYELRVYPGRRGYELLRVPDGDADEFPIKGRDEAIARWGERNTLLLEALVDTIRAKVNDKRIGTVFDPAAREMDGTRMTIVLGMEGRSKDSVRGRVVDVKVSVPAP